MIFSALSLSCFVGLGNTKDRDIQPKIECPAVIHPHSLGEILFSSSSEPSVCVCQDVWRWDGRPDQEVPNKKHLFNPRFKINKFPTSSHFSFFPPRLWKCHNYPIPGTASNWNRRTTFFYKTWRFTSSFSTSISTKQNITAWGWILWGVISTSSAFSVAFNSAWD